MSKWPRLSIKFDWMADSTARRKWLQFNCQTNWILSTAQSKTNDYQFEFRTKLKKEKRRTFCSFLGFFSDHFRSSFFLCSACVLPVFCSRQIDSSVYRQIGLTSVCRTWSLVGFSVIESPDRSTVTPITITLFSFFVKRRWKPSPTTEQKQLEQSKLDFE